MQDSLNLESIKAFLEKPVPRQILFFDEMLTPKLLQLAYWAALAAVVWSGLGKVFSGSFYGFIEGVVFIALGCLLARVLSELVMLFFQLHENMEIVAKNTTPPAPAKTTTRRKASKKVSKKTS